MARFIGHCCAGGMGFISALPVDGDGKVMTYSEEAPSTPPGLVATKPGAPWGGGEVTPGLKTPGADLLLPSLPGLKTGLQTPKGRPAPRETSSAPSNESPAAGGSIMPLVLLGGVGLAVLLAAR